jgi:predicted protein tyrosine phosphatase
MSPPELNLDWVTPALAVGGRLPVGTATHLARALGVRAVVDVRVEECDDEHAYRAHGIEFLHLPTVDCCAVSQPMLDHGVAWVSARLARDQRVLVHCEHGVGRSALVALCVLVERGAAPLEALERVKRARPVISPSPAQLLALVAFAAAHRAERGAPWEVPELRELGEIAWRHLREGGGASAADARASSTRTT